MVLKVLRHARSARETAIAVGSFDGVHLGHRAMFERVKAAARSRSAASAALTFEPLPREHFSPSEAPARLSTLGEKLELLDEAGLEVAFVERFDKRFAALDARAFAERLAGHYRARWVLVGPDFRFGAGRRGDASMLAEAGRSLGFEVEVLAPVMIDGQRASSTLVREALASADFDLAARLLGRRYAICGRVVHGAERGRRLGFPTANVRLGRAKPPVSGIFAVRCYGAATRGLEGVASLGINPAVRKNGPASLEAFLFDFSGDLYGRRLAIEFVKKLRDEAPFASLDALAAQIRRDCDAAREFFAKPSAM